jgi:hypothetical protein
MTLLARSRSVVTQSAFLILNWTPNWHFLNSDCAICRGGYTGVPVLNTSSVQCEQKRLDHTLLQSGVGGVRRVPRPGVVIALLGAFLTVALVPLFTCSPLPLADYPNHLARMYIITSLGHSPLLQRYYEIHWQLIPNLALDLIVPPLARFMPVERAMLVFTGLTLVLLVAGCFAVHRALFGRLSYAPFATFLLLYNRQLLWGMLNYLFALALALLTFALWIVLRRRPLGVRCGIFVILALMVFVSHLAGFGVLGVLIVGYEVHSFFQEKDYRALRNNLVAAAVALGLPVLIFVLFSPTRTRATPGLEAWGFKSRVLGLLEVFHNYILALDVVLFLIVVAAIGLALLLHKARLHNRMLLPIVTLALVYLIIPSHLFGTYYADRRLIPALFLILACSLEWNVRKEYFIAAIALLFVIRTAVVIKNWSAANAIYSGNLEIIDQIPRGAKVATAVGMLDSPALLNPPIGHLPAMAVVRRDVLINSVYAGYGYETLRFKPEYNIGLAPHLYYVDVCNAIHVKVHQPSVLDRIKRTANLCDANAETQATLITALNPFELIPLADFDYLLLVNKRYFRYPMPRMLRPIYSVGDTFLYRVVR